MNYWYKKKAVPLSVRNELKTLVIGDNVYSNKSASGEELKLYKVDGKVFRELFSINRKYLYRGDYTAEPNENDYEHNKNYVTEDGLAGFSVTKKGWLVSMFSNLDWCGFGYTIAPFLLGKINKLVCIATKEEDHSHLVDFYNKTFGFKPYVKTRDDSKTIEEYYGHDFAYHFLKEHGTPYHIFMIIDDSIKVDELKEFLDYFEAYRYVDETVKFTGRK